MPPAFRITLLSLLFPICSLANPAKTNVNSDALKARTTDAIEKAKKLFLQKERKPALQVLLKAATQESRRSKDFRELVRVVEQLGSYFVSERAQVLASNAQAIASERPREAIELYQTALKLDPDHFGLTRGMARIHLAQRECDKAATLIRENALVSLESGEVRLLKLQVDFCNQDYTALAAKLADIGAEANTDGALHFLRFAEAIQQNDIKKARAALQTWENRDVSDPEVLRAKWIIGLLTASPDRLSGDRYLKVCRTISEAVKTKYLNNPFVCDGVEKVAKEMREHINETN